VTLVTDSTKFDDSVVCICTQNWITQKFKSTQCNITEAFSQVFIDVCVYGVLYLSH